jgi:uncharacterized membrane protein YeaQ/YmgE (transglycosylase-associated protein family)
VKFLQGEDMSFFIWTALVGIIGWGASLAMKTDSSHRRVLHMSIGVLGAFLGGWLMMPRMHSGLEPVQDVDILSLLVSFFIALALSMIAKLWERVNAQDDPELDF